MKALILMTNGDYDEQDYPTHTLIVNDEFDRKKHWDEYIKTLPVPMQQKPQKIEITENVAGVSFVVGWRYIPDHIMTDYEYWEELEKYNEGVGYPNNEGFMAYLIEKKLAQPIEFEVI